MTHFLLAFDQPVAELVHGFAAVLLDLIQECKVELGLPGERPGVDFINPFWQ
jgi:hypothetical protein